MLQDGINNRKKTTVALAALTLALPLSGVALAGDEQGKGDERPQTAPGQEKKAENAAPQSAHAQNGNGYGAGKTPKPAKKPKAARPPKPAKPAKPVKPAKPAKPADRGAKARKVTICHSTGSAKNPFVQITVSENAVKAHARHHDGRDMVPAPAAGCPQEAPAAGAKGADAAKPKRAKEKTGKVTICHATGSAKNPYVKITIAEPAVAAHRRHHDGRDIIPAPEGDCPAPAATAAAAPAGQRKLMGAPATTIDAPYAAPRGGVLGAMASSDDAPESGVAAATARRESGARAKGASFGSLPFTGLETWLLIAAGVALLLAGVAGRRATANRA